MQAGDKTMAKTENNGLTLRQMFQAGNAVFFSSLLCLAASTPLVSGAAVRWTGQATSFVPARVDSPCFRCLHPDESVAHATCDAEGIVSPVVGVIGSLQALEVIRILVQAEPALCGRLLLFDGAAMDWQSVPLPRLPQCPDCGGRAP